MKINRELMNEVIVFIPQYIFHNGELLVITKQERLQTCVHCIGRTSRLINSFIPKVYGFS